jgi:hypothetical protein
VGHYPAQGDFFKYFSGRYEGIANFTYHYLFLLRLYPEAGENDRTIQGCSLIPETTRAEKKQEPETLRR